MARKLPPEILDLLLRDEKPEKVQRFVRLLREYLDAGCHQARVKASVAVFDQSSINARGSLRRAKFHGAVYKAAQQAGIYLQRGVTSPPTWDYPILSLGAFQLTFGAIDKTGRSQHWRVRNRGHYVQDIVAKNSFLDPALDFFELPRVYPKGAFGALIVAGVSHWDADVTEYSGIIVPRPDLKSSYFRISLRALDQELGARRRAEINAGRKPAVRKLGVLRKKGKSNKGE